MTIKIIVGKTPQQLEDNLNALVSANEGKNSVHLPSVATAVPEHALFGHGPTLLVIATLWPLIKDEAPPANSEAQTKVPDAPVPVPAPAPEPAPASVDALPTPDAKPEIQTSSGAPKGIPTEASKDNPSQS